MRVKNSIWLWILGIAAIFLYTYKLGNLPLRDWDEGIVATIAREIYRANPGDYTWLYPKNLDGSAYWNKPPLIHSLIALSYKFFGVSEWSTRLIPSLISAVSVSLVYLIGREIFDNYKPALISAVVYLTLIPVVRHNRLAMLDGAIATEFCLAIWCLLKLRKTENKKNYLLIIGLCFSLLSLTKGIAIAFLLLFIICLFVLTEYKSFYSLFSLSNSLLFLIGCFPAFIWYGLQYLHYGQEFINYNLGTQTFSRVINNVENNSQPFWYYFLELIKYSLPWLLFLPEGIKLAINKRECISSQLALIWFIFYLIVISLMTTKLPWYIIPIYPAFALLVGAKINQMIEVKKINNYQFSFLFLSVNFFLATIYFYFFNQPKDISLVAIAFILTLTFSLTTIFIKHSSRNFIITLTIGLYIALLTLFNTPHAIWELAEAYPVKPIAQLIKENTPKGVTIYTSYPYYRPSLNFYSDRIVTPLESTAITKAIEQKKTFYLLQENGSISIPNSKIIARQGTWQLILIE